MKILVVDDHPLVRKGLISVLAMDRCCKNFFEASNIEQTLRLIKEEEPDLAIIDLRLGHEDGLSLVKQARKIRKQMKYVILTSSIHNEDFTRAKRMEVDGYILKEAITEDLIYALHVIMRGKKYYDPMIMEYNLTRGNKSFDVLTSREQDVLNEIAVGLSNNEIAKKLFISEYTVKKHVSNILGKLNLSHRTEAALYANKIIQ
ncbi:response regulator [Vallitalea okinawensis]|uniref:response regulator n=1 Tax=Vallitalea okinawensis TaxID=2078660 RepID=UPI000CFE11DF|nr:response regulator transcription factor [Vallitalea okinawensis]